MNLSDHKSVGNSGEAEALRYLLRKGYRLRHKNFRTRRGELDIIMSQKETLVFVEVKCDRSGKAGAPEEWVRPAKVKKLQKLAQSYCQQCRIPDHQIMRFDVVCVDKTSRPMQIRHIENAVMPNLHDYY